MVQQSPSILTSFFRHTSYYERIDVSEEIDINKTSASRDREICHFRYFLDNGFIYPINVSLYLTKTMKKAKKSENHKNGTKKGIVCIETITRMKISNYNNSSI